MKKVKLAGTVILYNPSKENLENILVYLNEVDRLYLVCNSANIPKVSLSKKITYIYNSSNYGIAKSLNIAAYQAIKDGYEYLLTLDQDSKMKASIVKEMKDFISKTDIKNIGLISPY